MLKKFFWSHDFFVVSFKFDEFCQQHIKDSILCVCDLSVNNVLMANVLRLYLILIGCIHICFDDEKALLGRIVDLDNKNLVLFCR